DEVGIPQRGSWGEGRRVNAKRVLEVRADIRIGMVDRSRTGDAGDASDRGFEAPAADGAGRRGSDDVSAERQLRVDFRLLVVGRRENAEVDADSDHQAADKEPPGVRGPASRS